MSPHKTDSKPTLENLATGAIHGSTSIPSVGSVNGETIGTTDNSSISEILLPGYLLDFTRLRRDCSMAAQTIDVEWPRFKRPKESRQICQDLLNASACALSHVFPLVQEFYMQCEGQVAPYNTEVTTALRSLHSRYIDARKVIDIYKHMLAALSGPEYEMYPGPAEPDFPFSPIIQFSNPHMAHISIMPDVYMCFLAPFLSEEEHARSLRYVSGVLAYMNGIEGLQSNGCHPDLFIAAFWKPGPERAYFYKDMVRHKGDFMLCLTGVWETIDAISSSEQRQVSNTEKLGIALEGFRSAMINGFKLQHTPEWQTLNMVTAPWAVAVGCVNPLESEYSTPEEKARRRDFADVSYFHQRITAYRRNYGYIGRQATADSRWDSQQRSKDDLRSLADTRVKENNPYQYINYPGPDTFEEYTDSARSISTRTETGQIARKVWEQDPDKSKIYYII